MSDELTIESWRFHWAASCLTKFKVAALAIPFEYQRFQLSVANRHWANNSLAAACSFAYLPPVNKWKRKSAAAVTCVFTSAIDPEKPRERRKKVSDDEYFQSAKNTKIHGGIPPTLDKRRHLFWNSKRGSLESSASFWNFPHVFLFLILISFIHRFHRQVNCSHFQFHFFFSIKTFLLVWIQEFDPVEILRNSFPIFFFEWGRGRVLQITISYLNLIIFSPDESFRIESTEYS